MAGLDSDPFPVSPDRPLEPGALPFGRQSCLVGPSSQEPFPLAVRTVLLGTTEGSSQKMMAGDRALCWLLVCPAVATTTVMSVTWKLGSVWCSTSYHGNPCASGGSCQKCDCHPQGSVHSDRDHTSGQCVCKPGATGLCCEECWPRHILTESDCVWLLKSYCHEFRRGSRSPRKSWRH